MTDRPRTAHALKGKRIVVTRAPHQAAALADLLTAAGAEPVLFPCIDIALPEDTAGLDEALREAAGGDFDWLILTSSNTVRVIARRLAELDLSLAAMRTAAVGPATAEAAQGMLGLAVDLVAGEHQAEGLAADLGDLSDCRVFLPQSALARPVLSEALTAAGAAVTAVTAYQTVAGRGGADVPALLARGQIDAITFTSSSTVRYFLQRLEGEGGRRADLAGVCLAAIGPVTGRTMTRLALPAAVVASEYTLPGLVAALEGYFAAQPAANHLLA